MSKYMKDGVFQEMKSEDVEKLDNEGKHEYYALKLKHEQGVLSKKLEELEKNKDSENYKELAEEVKQLKEVQFNTLQKALEEQGEVMEKLKAGYLSAEQIRETEGSIEKALNENLENLKAHKIDNSRDSFTMQVKVAGDMTLAGNVTGGNMPQATRLPGVNDIAEREAKTYAMLPKLNVEGNTIEWVYEANQDGTITGTAEAGAKPQIDNDFVVTSVSLIKRAAHYKVSTEMLDDVSFMSSWLRNKLLLRLLLDIDNQCLNGNNTGTNMNSIINQATAFAAGTFALDIDNANNVDSLVVAMNQIRLSNHNGNLTVIMHPSDVAALKLVKLSTTDKRYIDRLMQVGSTLTVDGVPIIENVNITAGDFVVGDFSKANLVQKSTIKLDVGTDGNDFTNNMRTILAEWRGQLFIQNNDTTAFVKGTFATTNSTLETT